jgi:hypothetical protein
MKILVLVLSFNESPYKELMQAQQQSWDSIEVEGVRTVYYHGGLPSDNKLHYVEDACGQSSIRLQLFCTDAYYLMAAKFKMCLDYVKDWDYDIIFRTNSSSYVNKQRLKEFAATLPKEKLYAGWKLIGEGWNSVSGAGIFISKDVAEILRKEIDPGFEREEDILIGQILAEHKDIEIVDDKSRIDYTGGLQQQLVIASAQPYHIRFKTNDRLKDAANMKVIHKLITQ